MDYKEKAKAYDELLAKAKQIYNKENDVLIIHTIEELFPELAESEDEKIRKALIDGFTVIKESKNCGKTFSNHNIPVTDILAWLEKQGKKLSIWTDSDRIMAFTLLRDVDQMTYISDEGKNERLQWLNSLEDKFNNGE